MTDFDLQEENPFAPPQAEVQAPPAAFVWNPGVDLHAERVRQGNYFEELFRRRIQLSGKFVGVVEWREALHATVSVNDFVYCRQRNLGMNLIPRFEVPVQAGHPATLVVEVRSHNWCGFWTVIDAFRIRLDDRTLYSEGEWPEESGADRAWG